MKTIGKIWNVFSLIVNVFTIPYLGYVCYQVSNGKMHPKQLAIFVFIVGLSVLTDMLISNIERLMPKDEKSDEKLAG
jgi:hypothetical protein